MTAQQHTGNGRPVTGRRQYRFLFVMAMILGKKTACQNLRAAITPIEDVESTWITIDMPPAGRAARWPLLSRSHSLAFGLVARAEVRRLLSSGERYDAVFFNHILPAVFLGRLRKSVPCVDSMDATPLSLLRHGQAYYETQRRPGASAIRALKNRRARSLFMNSACLLPYSRFTMGSLVQDYGIPEEKIRVVAPGVSLEAWPGRAGTERVPGAPVRVLFVGGDFTRKGGDILAAVARRKEFEGYEFHFVSPGAPGGRTGNVIVHNGVNANSRAMLDLYRASDIFALPTRADFGPTNAVCEAMAMELPVITTPVGGLDEIVADGINGHIIPTGDADALAARLQRLGHDPGLRWRMGAQARETIRTRFNILTNARVIVDCLKAAAGAGSARESSLQTPASLAAAYE